jgi:hypothetical protein
MKSFIAVLTYRRPEALNTLLGGLNSSLIQQGIRPPIMIFEDCGNDDTVSRFSGPNPVINETLETMVSTNDWYTFHAGQRNLGVAGNSNRAIRAFMESDCDHLLLMNDDLHVLGDFTSAYGKAHEDLGIHLFCFNDFTSETYRWATVKHKGYNVKLSPRMTGIMMSITRKLVEKIGYFDTRFGVLGEEHCCYTIRSRIARMQDINDLPQHCLDIDFKPAVLRHQEVESSVFGPEREIFDMVAREQMEWAQASYFNTSYYRQFKLEGPMTAGVKGGRNPVKPPARIRLCFWGQSKLKSFP